MCLIDISFIWTKQIFWTQFFFCKLKLFIIYFLYDSKLFLDPKIFLEEPKKVSATHFFGQKMFKTQKLFCACIFCWPKMLSKKIWCQNFVMTQYCLDPQFYWAKKICKAKKLMVQKNLGSKSNQVQKRSVQKNVVYKN